MYICLCHAVTDSTIVEAMHNGACSVKDLIKELKVATQCGGCFEEVADMVEQYSKQSFEPQELLLAHGVRLYTPTKAVGLTL